MIVSGAKPAKGGQGETNRGQMSDDVLKVFEGLTLSQVKELRRLIITTLPELRGEMTRENSANRKLAGCNHWEQKRQ